MGQQASLNPVYPKYYQGYDMDVILQKLQNMESLTEFECNIMDMCRKERFQRNRANWEKRKELAKQNGGMIHQMW